MCFSPEKLPRPAPERHLRNLHHDRHAHFGDARPATSIEQRNWHGDIADPKTAGSRRVLALDDLVLDFKWHIAKLGLKDPSAWVFPQEGRPAKPMWDSGVRSALKKAAKAEGLDFKGFGLHSFRRANITWRQKHGGATSIEASKLAGHASVEMTNEYTFVDLERQRQTIAGIRARMAEARELAAASDAAERDALRARLAKARAAKSAKRTEVRRAGDAAA